MNQVRLLSKKWKRIEQEIVSFYKKIGNMMNLNSKMTEIFAYLKLYNVLTQKQLRQLTGISLGKISSTLQLFHQTNIVGSRMIPRTHTNLYHIDLERVNFVYTPSSMIIEDVEKLDSYIVERQAELEKMQYRHPLETQFLHLRLNSLRNYIEAQRRQIARKQKHSFFDEDVSHILPLEKTFRYPFKTNDIEEAIMQTFRYYRPDPTRNRILSIFNTHRSLTQQMLMDLSGFSRTTVSSFLSSSLNKEFIEALPKEHRRPRVYYLESISLSTLEYIINADNFIFSMVPRFQAILSELQSEQHSMSDNPETYFLTAKLQNLIQDIEDFEHNTRFIREAHQDLKRFLGR